MQILTREETKLQLLKIATHLHTVAISSYGPKGRAQLLQINENCADAAVISTASEQILRHFKFQHCAIGSVVLHMLKNQLRVHSDGGLFTAILSSKLLIESLDGSLALLPHQHIIKGLQLALEWCHRCLEQSHCSIRHPIDWSDPSAVQALIRGVLSAKQSVMGLCTPGAMERAVSLVLQSFFSIHSYASAFPSEPLPVRFVHEPHPLHEFKRSRVYQHTVFLDLNGSYHRHLQFPMENVIVALFNITVAPDRHQQHDQISIEMNQEDIGYFSRQAQQTLVDVLVEANVRVLLCQRILPRFLRAYAASRGMLAIDRLGITHMRAVQLLSRAQPFSMWQLSTIRKESLGFLSSIHRDDGPKPRVRFVHEPTEEHDGSVTTIVCALPDRHAYAAFTSAFEASLRVLLRAMETSEALRGAGCTELYLAAFLRHKASQLQPVYGNHGRILRDLRRVIDQVAVSLEAIAAAVRPSSPSEQIDDADKGGPLVLDSLDAKRDALTLAIECVSSLLRTASVVTTDKVS